MLTCVGIIAAVQAEMDAIRGVMDESRCVAHFELAFLEGSISGIRCVVAESGVGKVNAARAAQVMIDRYPVDYIINVGTAGILSSQLEVGDVVISRNLVQHDYDRTALGNKMAEIPNLKDVYIASDPVLVDACQDVMQSLRDIDALSANVVVGTVVSGDVFEIGPERAEKLRQNYQALCTEMEGAAIAQVCELCGVPFVAIRSMSGGGDDAESFWKFRELASSRCAQFLEAFFHYKKEQTDAGISTEKHKALCLIAAKIRRHIVEMLGGEGHVGHLGGSCSSADIVATLYGHVLRIRPESPEWPDRDRFIYSKGHAAIAQYAALAETGFFPSDELKTVKSLGSRLQGHPDRLKTPGIEAGTGSLGQGLSISCGMALGLRLDARASRVYCVMGDGELAEGQIWEAATAASSYKLDNLVGVVDCNGLQATGTIRECLDQGSIAEKWDAFGWHVIPVNGHDIAALIRAFDAAKTVKGKPTVLIADTVKGRGIPFAENVVSFHNSALTPEQYGTASDHLTRQIKILSEG